MNPLDYFDGPAAFGMRVRHLLDDIEHQLEEALAISGCRTTAVTTGIMLLLYGSEGLSIADVAKQLRYSHQLATKRIRIIEQAGLAKINEDPNDGRRRTIVLTGEGKKEARKLLSFLRGLEQAFQGVFDEIGINAMDVVMSVDEAMLGHSLSARIFPVNKRRRMAGGQ